MLSPKCRPDPVRRQYARERTPIELMLRSNQHRYAHYDKETETCEEAGKHHGDEVRYGEFPKCRGTVVPAVTAYGKITLAAPLTTKAKAPPETAALQGWQ